MVFNATFNIISAISWQSALLVEETRENHRTLANHWRTLSHNVVSSTPRHEWIKRRYLMTCIRCVSGKTFIST